MPNKLLLSILIVFMLAVKANAQEQYIFNQSQVAFNPFLYNPAMAGLKGYGNVSLSVRQNFKKIDGSPRTQILSFHNRYSTVKGGARRMGYNTESSNIGYGVYFYNDVEGPFRNQGLAASFTYHIALNRKGTEQISFGIGPTLTYSSINTNNLDVYDDPYLLFSNWKGASPDAQFGIQYKGQYGTAGLSAINLFEIPMKLGEDITDINKKRQYFINASGKFSINNTILLEPGVLLYTFQGDFGELASNFDINVKGYMDIFAAMIGYRNNVGMIASGAVQFEYFFGGLSYEIPFSKTVGVNYGTIEIFLGVNFGRGRNKFGDTRYF